VGAIKQPGDVFRPGGIAAEKPVSAQQDQLARPGDRRCRRLRDCVFIGETGGGSVVEQAAATSKPVSPRS
jgi:hypothetical protein